MPPSLLKRLLAGSQDEAFIHEVSDLLSAEECEAFIKKHEPDLISTSFEYSTRLRHIFDDDELADMLWKRLRSVYNDMRVVDEELQGWKPVYLNSRFRFCRYIKGDAFGAHTDGRRLANVNLQSFMTVNIYLNTVALENGGATRFLDTSRADTKSKDHLVLAKVQPTLGTASIFRDSLFHDGEEVKDGIKFLLRTDMMFGREEVFDFDAIYGQLDLRERGEKALGLARRLEDGGNGKDAMFWYSKAFKLNPELERTA
jgi:hypothetical protein